MAGTDNHRNSGSRRVNMKIWGGVPSFNKNLSRHQLSCPLVLRLLSYVSSRRRRRRRRRRIKKKKNMDKMGKKNLGITFTFGDLLLRFLVYCLVFTYKVL